MGVAATLPEQRLYSSFQSYLFQYTFQNLILLYAWRSPYREGDGSPIFLGLIFKPFVSSRSRFQIFRPL